MSWIDDVHAAINKTLETANAIKQEQARQEGVKAAQKDLINKTLGIVGPKDWDKKIEEGYDKRFVYREENGELKDGHLETIGNPRNIISEENPLMSFNREIPQTDLVKKIQSGQYKLASDTNRTRLNNDAALYVVGNTYQTNKDGTNYGVGWNGRPYSYTVKGGIVGEFNELGPEEASKAISKLTEGKVTADPTTLNNDVLASIYRSLERIKSYNKGNLPDGYINISAMTDRDFAEYPNAAGLTAMHNGTKEKPVEISLDTDWYDPDNIWKMLYQKKSGWWTTGTVDSVTQHELGHALDSLLSSSAGNYYSKVDEEAKEFDNKYDTDTLIRNTFSNFFNSAKYIPVALGFVTPPSYEEYEAIANKEYDKKNKRPQEEKDFLKYWNDWFETLEDAETGWRNWADSEGDKMRRKADDFVNEKLEPLVSMRSMLEKAAKNAGYDSVEDAMESSSSYGSSSTSEFIAESFADALINKENASAFSKEFVKLMEETAEKIRDTIDKEERKNGKKKYPEIKSFLSLIDLLPQYGGKQEYGDFLNRVKSLNIK